MPYYDHIVALTLQLGRWRAHELRPAPPPRLRLRAAPRAARNHRGVFARLQAFLAALNRMR